MRFSTLVVLTATLSFAQTAEAYSGFVKDAGSGYAKLSYNFFGSNELYDTSGELSNFGSEFSQQNLSLYAEYGVLDFLTVGLDVPLLRLNSFEAVDRRRRPRRPPRSVLPRRAPYRRASLHPLHTAGHPFDDL